MLKPEVIAILACPRCASRPPLELDGEEVVCGECGARYPIVNGIPHLIPPSPTEQDHGRE